MTLQAPDKLIHHGQTYDLYNPPGIPLLNGKIVERTGPNGLIRIHRTDCWRGYMAVWEIRGNRIFLKDVIGCYEKLCEEDILAHWISSSLNAKDGDNIPTRLGLMVWPLCSIEKTIEVEKGLITSVSTQNNGLLCKQIESAAKRALVDAKKEIASRSFNILSYLESFLSWRKKVTASALSKDRSDTLLRHMRRTNPLLMSRPRSLELFDLIINVDAIWDDPEFSIAKENKRQTEIILASLKSHGFLP